MFSVSMMGFDNRHGYTLPSFALLPWLIHLQHLVTFTHLVSLIFVFQPCIFL